MMPRALVINARFHDGRYHGDGGWPPSPARLFQALVAAAGLSGQLNAARASLQWLERLLPAPIIGAPRARRGQSVMFYMPNNDLDAVQGDPRRVAEIRTATKFFVPWLFDAATPILYVWPSLTDADEAHARAIVALADRLYQLGRGIDMAWAWGEVIDNSAVEDLLMSHAGPVFRPSAGGNGITLRCPRPDSLDSIEKRYRAYGHRFEVGRTGKRITFRQPPRPSFSPVAYESPPTRYVFELRASVADSALASWPLGDVSKLVVCLRDAAVARLETAWPDRKPEIDRVLVGRKPDGTNDGPTAERVKVIPLPSIGHPHADRAVRRILVEVPAACPLRPEDVSWAFSGLAAVDADTSEAPPFVLTRVPDSSMLSRYGIGANGGTRTWRTVTAAALPEAAGRRRIDPARKVAEAKAGAERAHEQRSAAAAVAQALRHIEVDARVAAIRLQREPFESNGERVEAFAKATRFPKERLWHVEVTFAEPVSGPLVIGDGRFLGLGLMAPVCSSVGLHVFTVTSGLEGSAEPINVARALRRAVMARVQEQLGPEAELPPYFSGHEADGSRARSEVNPHLAFAFDPRARRLIVIAPHVMDRRAPTPREHTHLGVLDDALRDFREVRGGASGRLEVERARVDSAVDSLLRTGRSWASVTDYTVTRHARRTCAPDVLRLDIQAECRRRGLPEPNVVVTDARGIGGVGLVGRVRLSFPVAIEGPLLLGKTQHLGGGLFAVTTD